MNSVQIHLALTHVPVIILLVGLGMLLVAYYLKNNTLVKTAYILLLIAGIGTIPVYFSGEGTEEVIEKLPGISEAVIEEHEEIAKLAFISVGIAGIFALAALVSAKWPLPLRIFRIGVLMVAVLSAGLMIRTAHLGGQIRHTELNGVAFQELNAGNLENEKDKKTEEKEED